MEFGIEKSDMLEMEGSKRHLIDGMELPNQDKIRTLGKKENYKYLEADIIKQIETDTIKQEEKKRKKLRKNIPGELDSYLRQNYQAETLSKE